MKGAIPRNMYTDMNGKRRLKIGLHTHTTQSDGHKTPEEAIGIYTALGYDAIALTDHWTYTPAHMTREGLKLLSGCEYNIGGNNGSEGVYHIVGIGMTQDPGIDNAEMNRNDVPVAERARAIIQAIREAGGMAIFAHPAWSLNTPEQILAVGDFDALEIYNSVSEAGMSDRPYSGLLVDMIAGAGCCPPLVATDDTHYYAGEEGRGFIMVEFDAVEAAGGGVPGLMQAIKDNRFYASQGPEIHLTREDDKTLRLTCSPCEKIVFMSNIVWTRGRVTRGEALTEATYTLHPGDTFVRAEVTDKDGRCAWSHIIKIQAGTHSLS